MMEERIVTPCPSCGAKTLFIGSGGHLTCSWLKCKEPTVSRAITKLRNDLMDARQLATDRGRTLQEVYEKTMDIFGVVATKRKQL